MNYYLATDNFVGSAQMQSKHTTPRPILPKGPVPAAIGAPLQEKPVNLLQIPNSSPIANNKQITTNDTSKALVPLHLITEPEDPLVDEVNFPTDFDLMTYVAEIENQQQEELMVSTQKETSTNENSTTTSMSSIQKITRKKSKHPCVSKLQNRFNYYKHQQKLSLYQ